MTREKKGFFSGNALKLLALASMTADHIGVLLLDGWAPLRLFGRLAFPIFAYMIAEGCEHTKNKKRYFGGVFFLGVVCQIVYYAVDGSLYQCILITFSLSILLVYALQWAAERGGGRWAGFALALLGVWFLCVGLPQLLPGTDYRVDYGFWGVVVPALIFVGRNSKARLALTALGLVAVSVDANPIQWWSLLALLPLALYSGSRGKWRLKNLFYVYYPAHLVFLWGLAFLLNA